MQRKFDKQKNRWTYRQTCRGWSYPDTGSQSIKLSYPVSRTQWQLILAGFRLCTEYGVWHHGVALLVWCMCCKLLNRKGSTCIFIRILYVISFWITFIWMFYIFIMSLRIKRRYVWCEFIIISALLMMLRNMFE